MKLCLSRVLISIVLVMMAQISWAERAVVLVVGRDSPIEDVTTLDIRKAYLGITIDIDGRNVSPLRSRDDEELNQIFLQAVIAMTSRTYARRLMSSALKYGRPRPREARNRNELIEMIANSPFSIAYMWKSDAESDSRVKIVRVLWQEL